jgi:hypothetical protein
MARSAGAEGKSSEVEATTLNFGTKTAWEELATAKRQASNRAASANGTYGKLLTKMVKEQHMDRTAVAMALKLAAIEDDSDLHVTVHHLLDGLAKLGVLQRAMVSDELELFDEHKVAPAVKRAKEAAKAGKGPKPDKKGGDKKANGADADMGNVRKFPDPSGIAAE